jgi:cobalt-zinc-cadmium efflux system outer membrane protein
VGWLLWALILSPLCWPQDSAQREWSESEVVQRFLALSPHARELRARVNLTVADAVARTVYPNPSFSYSREGAGYNAFFEASQTLPVNGRIRYLREAGAAAVSAADANREAMLWSLRSDLRLEFYRIVSVQERMRTVSASIGDVEQLVRVLRQREEEGEGSRYDRLRAEREVAELRTDFASVRSLTPAAIARVTGYLPEGTIIEQVRGDLRAPSEIPGTEDLVRRAMNARAEYRVGQENIRRYQFEQQAASRLRFPEPQVTAGVKRADVLSGTAPDPFSNVTRTGVAFGVSIPIPVFNTGRYEVARYQAQQEQATAQSVVLSRQIRTEIEGARGVLMMRMDALTGYQREIGLAGGELTRITQVAYQEGEIGILELLDSLRVSRAASLRLIELQASVKEAVIELERAVGEEFQAQEVRP